MFFFLGRPRSFPMITHRRPLSWERFYKIVARIPGSTQPVLGKDNLMSKSENLRRRSGFTLVELLIVAHLFEEVVEAVTLTDDGVAWLGGGMFGAMPLDFPSGE